MDVLPLSCDAERSVQCDDVLLVYKGIFNIDTLYIDNIDILSSPGFLERVAHRRMGSI